MPAPVDQRSGRSSGTALWMTLGTLTVGLSGYVFLSVIGHDRFTGPVVAALTSTYLLTNIVGPGVFGSIEQETSRAVSDGLVRGMAPGRPARRLAVIAVVLAVLTLAVVAVAAPTLSSRVLEGDFGLLAAIGLTVVGSAAVFLVRGLLGGQGQFGLYAATLILDGGTRLIGLSVLVIAGDRTPARYAMMLAIGPIVAAIVVGGTVRWRAHAAPRPTTVVPPAHPSPTPDNRPASWSLLGRAVALLMLSSVLAFAISNLSPVLVTAAMPDAPAVAAGFAVALVLTRVPLLLMAPVQAVMLPRMARAVARQEMTRLRRDLARCLLVVAGFGLVLVTGVALLGRLAIRLLFGASLDTSTVPVLALLAVSATLLIAIQLVQPAMVALRRTDGLILGWAAGAVGFLLVLVVLPISPLAAAVSAQLAGPAVTLAVHLSVLRSGLRDVRSPAAALTHE